ncbi:MAG: glycosyltransferase family 2 protein [bacterium]
MKLSIIIVNYNTKDFLLPTLSAIYLNPPRLDFEIIVVDNASTDGSIELIRKKFPFVRLIKNSGNVGFARATNQAIPRTKGEYILFLNPDVIPQWNAIQSLVDFLEHTQNVGCVGGKLLNTNGSIQFSCRSFPNYINVFFGRQSLLSKLFPKSPFHKSFLLTEIDHNKTQKVDWIIGACILTKREILEQIGYLDETFFLFLEDTDFCYRIKKAGFDTIYFPDALFYHSYGASINRFWVKSNIAHNISMYRFFKKHYNPNVITRLIAMMFLTIRVLVMTCIYYIHEKLLDIRLEKVPKVGLEPTPHF